MIKVLMADDHTLMRDGLETILSLEHDIEVVGSARTGEEALEMTGRLLPHVVLMDIQMPGMSGIACTKRMKELYPDAKVLILTTFAEEEYIIEAFTAGAVGFLLKDMSGDKLTQSIRDALAGQFILPSAIAVKLISRLAAATSSGAHPLDKVLRKSANAHLTDKETRVARLMLEGSSNREIAERLYMSEGTAKNYVSAIYNKIGTNDRTIAVMTLRGMLGE
ncbi:response regulator [Paenibacillus allorhizosphaerae]|uniref:Transcriptional regulatory protein DegU n=1 Tax=Paenibacillus allorhizosphaerae TaxID=2849866 RepID=A0ABM8VQ54_9BACL|nr:response regulator transcription factor [Paenibacillus allorhizosphaerae]CAG7653820.1 Transcriptional regulatory protein DegU [Paenibacillus allorhizosphaerae]